MKYKVLDTCEFTSTRKRMSCIFRDPYGRIILMCKGADSVITERLTQLSVNSNLFKSTEAFVSEFADQGLRTLYLAERYLDEDEY